MEAPGPDGPLKGVLAGGGQGNPVVLIIPGSGPTDREGNNPLGVKAATYRLIAEGLAEKGVTTVRIDKRGLFASAAASADPNAVTIDDYVEDTLAWVAAIRQRTGTRCVWLLGHSEGGLVALAAMAKQQEHICGLVLASTAGRPLGDVLKAQLLANPANAPLADHINTAIDTLSRGKHVDTSAMPSALQSLFRPQVQGFLISAFGLDPARLIMPVGKPILILQGERDLQMDAADAARLKMVNPRAVLRLLPDTNHVLKTVNSDDRRANIETYSNPDLPLAAGVVDVIAQFVTKADKAP